VTAPPTTPAGRLPGLDLMRGIAALCVLALHLHANFRDHPGLFAKGYLAVDLFFMLSGYVMARTYEPRLVRGLSAVTFFVARYRRLWPIMAAGSLLGLPKLYSVTPDLSVFAAAAAFNLMLLPIPGRGPAFPLNIPAWSIYFELTANLVHGLLFWRLGGRWLAGLALVCLPLTIWAGMAYGNLDFGGRTEQYLAGLPRTFLSYLIGIVLWRWWRDLPPLRVPPMLAFAALPAFFVLAWAMDWDGWIPDVAFVVLVCPLLIAGGLRFDRTEGRTAALAAALGALSFPLYAVHMPVVEGMAVLHFSSAATALASLAAGIALTLAAEGFGQWRKKRREALA
jgi:peptidoglycan/LPS O-acetylase OafA/YrhL